MVMDGFKNFLEPIPIVDQKEAASLDILTGRYNKLIAPSQIAIIGKKAGKLIPEKVKSLGSELTETISAQELYKQAMELVANGFKVVEEQAAKFSISEKTIVKKVNSVVPEYEITELSEICLARSYKLSKLVNDYRKQNILAAFLEGGITGAAGFWGLPFNLVLSTFLYFRAVQSIAMFYGYDVKNNSDELVIANEVFTSALNPSKSDVDNEVSSIIGKIMLMSQAAVVKQTANKTWTDMAARGGVPLLLTQMRALAHKTAQKALEKAGTNGLERSVFKEVFEQIGRKLTLRTVQKAVPVVSAVFGALIDTAQMNKVLEYADIFYQKRYILEKESRIMAVVEPYDIVVDSEIIEDET
jgi:hypothetical protein